MTGTGFHDQGYSGTGTSYQGQQGGFHQQGGMTQQSGLATHQIETTTTSTSVLQPTLQTQLPLTLNEDVTKEYMPLRNTDGMKELIARMEKASLEIDAYAKAKQELVSKEAVELINEEMQRCKSVQDRLNTTLRDRCNSLDDDFATRREAMMRDLDKEKAQQMINLQSELQKQQESILAQSRARIDEITMKAKQKKLEIVKAAQEQHNSVSTTVTDAAILMTPTDSINNVTISKDELRPDSGCGSCSSTSTRKCTTAGCTTSDCTGCGDSQTIRGSQFPNTGSEFNNHPGHVKSSFGRTQQEQAGMAAGRNAEEPVMRRDGHGVGQY
jgi:phage host-nuclease inhibitor protein Gam